jgi:hypothetical protein
MTNQKGFVLPTTIILMFLLCSFVTYQVSQYAIEKIISKEQAELYTAERLLQKGVVDVMELLRADSSESFSGKIYYEEGEVTYTVKKEQDEIKSVHVLSKTVAQKTKQITFFYYVNDETVLPWLGER